MKLKQEDCFKTRIRRKYRSQILSSTSGRSGTSQEKPADELSGDGKTKGFWIGGRHTADRRRPYSKQRNEIKFFCWMLGLSSYSTQLAEIRETIHDIFQVVH